MGARWDRAATSWYVPAGVDIRPFSVWLTDQAQETAQEVREGNTERVYLAVPFKDKSQAKQLGARWEGGKTKSWYVPAGVDMKPLSQWLPDNVETQQEPAKDPQTDFAEVLKDAGFVLDELPVMDGRRHRVYTLDDNPKKDASKKSGVYCGYLDGRPAGWYMDFRTQDKQTWISQGEAIDPEETGTTTGGGGPKTPATGVG